MPITLGEKVESREWSNTQITLVYVLTGTSSDLTAQAVLLSSTAESYGDFIRQTPIDMTAVFVDTATDDGIWECTVRYVKKENATASEIGSQTVAYDTTGGTQHVTQSLQTVGKYPSGTAPDYQGAVGVNRQGGSLSVEGVDVGVATFHFTVTRVFAAGEQPSMGVIHSLTYKTNGAEFTVVDTQRGDSITLAAGECLFLGAGAAGGIRSDGGVEIAFHFDALPNKTGLSVGGIGGIDKKGFEYLWAAYEEKESGTRLVKQPFAAYVEKVYEEGDFAALTLLSELEA